MFAYASVCISRFESNRMRNLVNEHLRSVSVGWNSLNYSSERSEKKKQIHTRIYAFNKCYFLGCSIRHDRSYSSSLMLLIFCVALSLPFRSHFSFSLIYFAFNKHIVRLNVVNDTSIQFHSFQAEHFMLHIHSTPDNKATEEKKHQQNRLRYFISWLCV